MEEHQVECPYCGENIPILIDTSAGGQEYYEDCSVCCCAIFFNTYEDILGHTKLVIKRDDE